MSERKGAAHRITQTRTYNQTAHHQPRSNAPMKKNSGVVYGPNNLPPDYGYDDGPSAEDEERSGGPWTSAMMRKTAITPPDTYTGMAGR